MQIMTFDTEMLAAPCMLLSCENAYTQGWSTWRYARTKLDQTRLSLHDHIVHDWK